MLNRTHFLRPAKALIRFLYINALALGALAQAAEISGFRYAEFGASEAVLRQQIAEDFNISDTDIKGLEPDTCTGTQTLEVKLSRLGPIDAPATISYILGYRCRCLIQVNVIWILPESITTMQREKAFSAITTLSEFFSNQLWQGAEVFKGRIFGAPKENQVTNYIFFRAAMPDYTAVTIWGAPVVIAKQVYHDKTSLTANTNILKKFAVTYELNIKRPDLMRHPDTEKCLGRRVADTDMLPTAK